MNKKVKVSFENFGVDKKKIENETDDKLTVKADNKLFFYKRDVHFCKIVFSGQAENSGGYLTVNGFAISVNSTVIMPICPPVAFELGLIISPYSSIVFEELTFEELGEKEYLDEASYRKYKKIASKKDDGHMSIEELKRSRRIDKQDFS